MNLTQSEINSGAIQKVKADIERRLTEYRLHNDKFTLTESETAAVRGRIAELKSLLTACLTPGKD